MENKERRPYCVSYTDRVSAMWWRGKLQRKSEAQSVRESMCGLWPASEIKHWGRGRREEKLYPSQDLEVRKVGRPNRTSQ